MRMKTAAETGKQHWEREILDPALKKSPERAETFTTISGRPIDRLYTAEDLEGIAEHPRSIGGTKMALFFRDLGHNRVKVSFRSTGSIDVNAFAKQFGGGGHLRAAGALITGNLEEVRHAVVAAAREYLGRIEGAKK